jgi:hypothetical protein
MRRAAAGSVGFALAALALAFAVNAFHIQDGLCRVPGVQPVLSDMCGALHLGDAPSRDERIAWQARPAGSCDALRDHIARFPNGVYRNLAADLLEGGRISRAQDFTTATRAVRGYVRQSEQAFVSAAQAQDDARARALTDAEQIACAPHDAFERTGGAVLDTVNFDCRAMHGGQVCAADYAATCRIEARAPAERCG